jgi:UDP-N-acetylglucosamine 2-epimerase (hydrolysing)
MRKIVFLTGTRAEFGKMKPLMKAVEDSIHFECFIFVTGMHMLKKYGETYKEVLKMNFSNVTMIANQTENDKAMDIILANTVQVFSNYVRTINPDLIITHGDRLEALAATIVGIFNNIRIAHIEGGEKSGTVDDSIRHAVTKLAHIHFVSNEEAKKRILQLGEKNENVFVIGSPDIDIMLFDTLPAITKAKEHYDIRYKDYGIFLYHPVVTEQERIKTDIKNVIDALIESAEQYIVIYPNNDIGTEIIQEELTRLTGNENFRIFPSIRFEYFLTFLRHAKFMIGNSSAGIRETCIYGIPSIDIGSRQQKRYTINTLKNVQHVQPLKNEILNAIKQIHNYRININMLFGEGNSTEKFMDVINDHNIWNIEIQKSFIDIDF